MSIIFAATVSMRSRSKASIQKRIESDGGRHVRHVESNGLTFRQLVNCSLLGIGEHKAFSTLMEAVQADVHRYDDPSPLYRPAMANRG